MREGKTIEAAYALYQKFDELVETQATKFITLDIDAVKMRLISCMRNSNQDNSPLFQKVKTKLENFRSLKAIIKFLKTKHFINYLSQGLLITLSVGANCPFLQDGDYIKDLSCFFHSTHLSSFPEIFADASGELKLRSPKGIPTLIIHLESKWYSKTMLELVETLEKYCKTRFHSTFILLNILSNTHKTLLDVVFAVWPCNAVSIAHDFTNSKDLLQASGAFVEFSKEMNVYSGQQPMVRVSFIHCICRTTLYTNAVFLCRIHKTLCNLQIILLNCKKMNK